MTETSPKRQFAVEIVQTLREHGYEAYWAGGCVRDFLLGKEPDDYDVATSARPEEVRRLFGRRKTIAVGAAFGVIVVVGPKGAGQVEVATFRSDAAYSDGRRPDAVTYSTAREDVLRRDFTINGMLYDPLDDRVLDFVGGQEDLRRGILRAIGDARQRLAEDKLRMLRAVRFSARFGFSLEEQTVAAVAEMAPQITIVSAERITQEFRAMLEHPARHKAMELCHQLGLLTTLLPELAPLVADDSRWRRTLDVLELLPEPSFPLVYAALLHVLAEDVDAASCRVSAGAVARLADGICRRWKFSNDERELVVWLLAHRTALRDARQKPWPRVQRIMTHVNISDLLALHEAELTSLGLPLDDTNWCRAQLGRPRAEWDPPPLITGDDLLAHGVPQGKIYQQLLEAVRDAQLEGRIESKPEALALVDKLLAADKAP
jgi:poly(A) polymerase